MGTHIRVGQEDNLFDVGHAPFKSNAAQVEKVKRILGEFGIEFATSDRGAANPRTYEVLMATRPETPVAPSAAAPRPASVLM